jgi:hypothetical protein
LIDVQLSSLIAGTVTAAASSSSESSPGYKKGKLLILGGTGFVGSKICERAIESGFAVVSVSRRGLPPDDIPPGSLLAKVEWRAGDLLAKPDTARAILSEGGFVGCVHAVGMLLASDLNAIASGSGSTPNAGGGGGAVVSTFTFTPSFQRPLPTPPFNDSC